MLTLLSPLTPLADSMETTQKEDTTETDGSMQSDEQVTLNQMVADPSVKNVSGTSQTFNDWFPDDNLAKAVANELSMQPTDPVSLDELSRITEFDCSNQGIKDMSGIEFLSRLVFLWCDHNEITTLDISKNQNLEFLGCDNNQLTELDISQNKYINTLSCTNNQLTELDVSQNSDLDNLYCDNNKITTFHFNPELSVLTCRYNQLKELDLSAIDDLWDLECSGNQLTRLDVSKHTRLGCLICDKNQLTKLDVSQNPDLDTLYCSNNQLVELDLSHNPILAYFECADNQLTGLDLSQNPKMGELDASGNQLATLDLTHNKNLYWLDASGNQLTTLDLSYNKNLNWLYLDNNKIQDFSFIPSSLMELSAMDQTFTLDMQEGEDGKLTIPVSTALKDETGAAMVISPSDGGVYDSATNTITWSNLPASGEVSYSFTSSSGFCGGTMTIPYQVGQPISLTADDEITYNQMDPVSEAQFLQDIHAQTEEGNQLSSDFETAVDFSTPGDYEVTITASNNTKTIDKKVMVHIAATDDHSVTPKIDPTDAETNKDQDNQEEQLSENQNLVVKVNQSNHTTQKTALPKTGDQSAIGWTIFGSATVLLGIYLVRRKK